MCAPTVLNVYKQKTPRMWGFIFRYNTTSNPSNSGCPKYISWCFPPLLCAALNASDFFQFSKSFFDSHTLCDAYRVYSSFEEPLIRLNCRKPFTPSRCVSLVFQISSKSSSLPKEILNLFIAIYFFISKSTHHPTNKKPR